MIRYLLVKYLRPGESFGFITITKWLAFAGIALGVAVLLVSMAVMNGLNISFAERLMVMNYPITLYPLNAKSAAIAHYLPADRDSRPATPADHPATPADRAATPAAYSHLPISPQLAPSAFIQTQAAIKSRDSFRGIALFGVDFEREIAINPILRQSVEAFAAARSLSTAQAARLLNDGFFIITGTRASSAAIGAKLTVLFSQLSPAGLASAPLYKRFSYAGSFSSGLAAYDSTYAFTSLGALARILRTERISGIHLASRDADADAAALRASLAGRFSVAVWWEQNGSIIAAMALEKRALFLILAMLVLIAALNIITSLLMIVLNRRKEIALLLALGASAREVRGAFFAVGFAIGAAGTAAGAALGAAAIWALGRFDLIELPADVYGSSRLPLDLSALDGWLIITGALAISAAAALYPAAKAARTDALATLRED